MQKLIVASANKGKLREIKELLSDRYDIISMSDAGISVDIEETGETFEENALIKAKAVYALCGCPVISDDSGLVVYATRAKSTTTRKTILNCLKIFREYPTGAQNSYP